MSSYISSTWSYLASFLPSSYDAAALKSSLKLASIALSLTTTQKENFIKQKERECLTYMMNGKEFEAKLLMETILIEQGKLKCFAILKQLLLLLESRQKIIDEAAQDACPYALKEAVSSVIYASVRLGEVRHLDEIREQFRLKFGDEFIETHKENKEMSVNLRVVDALDSDIITGPLILENMRELAKKNEVQWQPRDFELYALTSAPRRAPNIGADTVPRAPGADSSSSMVYPSMSDDSAGAPMYPSLDSSNDNFDTSMPPSSMYSGGYSQQPNSFTPSQSSYSSMYGSVDSPPPQAPVNMNPNYQPPKNNSLSDSGLSQEDYSDILARFERLKAGSSIASAVPSRDLNSSPSSFAPVDDNSSVVSSQFGAPLEEDEANFFQEQPAEEDAVVLGKAVALFSYEATRDDELSAKQGEEFDIVFDKSGQEGQDWLLCRSKTTGSIGYLPSNHLRRS